MNYHFKQYDGGDPKHAAAAALIQEWSEESASMIPLTAEAMDAHKFGVVGFSGATTLMYAGITVGYTDSLVEFGGLVVNPDYKRQGIAQAGTEHILSVIGEMLPATEQVIAFANSKSLPLFQKIGAKTLTQAERDELSKDVWKLCFQCPNKPDGFCKTRPNCCDTVVSLPFTGASK